MVDGTPGWAAFAHRYPIDGLRAIAALVVVLFHAQMPGMGNGFVGVDVFFVLSGFLITSLLLRERLTDGRISLRGFYSRRMRRLLPAALLVLAVTVIVYQLVAPPLDVLENRMGFVFAAVYLSNWYFLAQAQDYFAAAAAPSPVMHYWSLSVEEQYYLVWPALFALLLAVALVRRRLAPWIVGALAVVALAGSFVLDQTSPTGAYFNTFARAYQLLAGAALATGLVWWRRRRADRGLDQPTRGTLGAGLALAGVVVVIVASTSLLPLSAWWIGLIGVAATLAILLGVELSPSSRALAPLAVAPMRALGRWSYSTYLWHWPVIVIAGVVGVLPVEWWIRVPAVLVVTIGLAALTFRFVERPVNAMSVATARRQLRAVAIGLAATAAAAVLSLVVLRVPAQAQELVALAQQGQAAQEQDGDATATIDISDDLLPTPTAPTTAGPSGTPTPTASGDTRATSTKVPTLLVVGDSHADFWRDGLKAYAKDHGFRVIFVVSQGCPWMDIPALSDETGKDHMCQQELWQPALAAARKYRPDATMLISRSVLSRRLLTPDGIIRAEDPGWEQIVRDGTTSSLAQIAAVGGQVALVEPIPQTADAMLACLSRGKPAASCSEPAIPTTGTAFVEGLYQELANDHLNVHSVSLDDIICPGGTCPAAVKGVPTFVDDNHLTFDYARMLVPQLLGVLAEAGIVLD